MIEHVYSSVQICFQCDTQLDEYTEGAGSRHYVSNTHVSLFKENTFE